MFAGLRRRIFVWRTLRRVDRHIRILLRAHGGFPKRATRICGRGYEGTISKTGSVNVRVEGPRHVETFTANIEVEQ